MTDIVCAFFSFKYKQLNKKKKSVFLHALKIGYNT
jgi:hypothetical protein